MRPFMMLVTKVEYAARWVGLETNSRSEMLLDAAQLAASGMTASLEGASGGGVSSTRAGVGVVEGREGRGGKVSMPSAVGWEEGTGSSTMRAIAGRSSSEESPVRVLAVLYSLRRGHVVERAVWPLPVLPARCRDSLLYEQWATTRDLSWMRLMKRRMCVRAMRSKLRSTKARM